MVRLTCLYSKPSEKMNTELLFRYFSCKTTESEDNEIRRWLTDDSDGSSAQEYKAAHMLFLTDRCYSRYSDFPQEHPRQSKVKSVFMALGRVAAAAVIAVLAGLYSNMKTIDSLSEKTEIINIPAGERVQMTLADGTQIWLNSGTQVEIPVIFSKKQRRLQLLEGEILLDVKKDTERPFVVETWAGDVEVLGTKFDVMADEENRIFSTALLEGSVQITSKSNPENRYILKPNDIATMSDGNLNIGRIKDASSVDCWSSGLIDVTDIPFDLLMKKFEKAYDVRIFIDRQDLPVITYTRGKIRISDGIDHALSVLQLAGDFSYSFDRVTNTVIIR